MSYLKKTFYFLGLLVLVALPLSSQAATWPQGEAEDISQNTPSLYEPSGAVWHDNGLLVVSDEGYLIKVDVQGNILQDQVYVGGDLEGITIKGNYAYLLNEYPQQVIEFDLSTWSKTGNFWDLSDMLGNSSEGAEALTYNSNQNLWYVGSQYDGQIYTYDNNFNYVGVINTGFSKDCSGIFYDQENNITHAIFDRYNTVLEIETEETYQLPGSAQEGIAIHDGLVYIAQDSGAIMRYGDYIEPVTGSIAIIETGSSGIPYIQEVVEGDYILSMEDLKNGVPAGTEVVIFPGGADFINYLSYTIFPFSVYLDTDITQSLQEFVNAGGGFVGICGGSIIGSELLSTDIDYSGVNITQVDMASLAPVTAVDYMEWYDTYAGSQNDIGTLSFEDHVIAGDYASGTHLVDYYGGPYFKDYSNVEVLATYTKDFMTGQPAIVAKDNVVLSAVHPEYDSETQFLLENMIAWVKGELVQPEPVDVDGDGYPVEEDCDDNNSDIHENQTYYLDNDQDGLGDSQNSTSICSLEIPNGYVDDNNDSNDNDYDNDGSEIGIDCNDADDNIQNNQTYYADTDSDGLGDPDSYIEVCSFTIPEGYVNNNSDEPGEPAPEPEPVDEDGDGYSVEEDCDDNNASVYTEITYYYDYDQDGLGNPYSTLAVCSLDIPVNYTNNANDLNDYDYDNDSVSTDSDCNDADATIWDLQRYYADTDSDGLGDPENYIEACSLTIPEGYVTNYSDEPGEPAPEPEPEVEELTVKVKGRYININGEKTKIFKHKPIKSRYSISEDESQIIVIGLFKKRATIVTLELDSDYQITSQEKNIIRYSHAIKKLKAKIKDLKATYF